LRIFNTGKLSKGQPKKKEKAPTVPVVPSELIFPAEEIVVAEQPDATTSVTIVPFGKVVIYIRISHRGINVDHGINIDQHSKPRNKC
jgi:hypothetical protein